MQCIIDALDRVNTASLVECKTTLSLSLVLFNFLTSDPTTSPFLASSLKWGLVAPPHLPEESVLHRCPFVTSQRACSRINAFQHTPCYSKMCGNWKKQKLAFFFLYTQNYYWPIWSEHLAPRGNIFHTGATLWMSFDRDHGTAWHKLMCCTYNNDIEL